MNDVPNVLPVIDLRERCGVPPRNRQSRAELAEHQPTHYTNPDDAARAKQHRIMRARRRASESEIRIGRMTKIT